MVSDHNMPDYEQVRDGFAWEDNPREIEFRDELPKTVTGKIRRTELQDEVEEEAEAA
ncbi:hypothetical protein [Haloterrigena alkaliphila]|uniref:AMP-binding enzyme C-terminal domain-containing protein n=1 Tax=Haloterrigena alkaliphila TaxID=2816475 RepID=A0A8A2VI90_9EURY|nr:hypothetical protein [Haloterrigena alkaliphila]QSX01242.1 hypothetical protein J0X25_06650 [Haloterrigena alkaliphila]